MNFYIFQECKTYTQGNKDQPKHKYLHAMVFSSCSGFYMFGIFLDINGCPQGGQN